MKTPKSFEAGAARLEAILAKMSDSETPLAQAVQLYAEAAELMAFCTQTLDSAALQMQEIDAKWNSDTPQPEETKDDTADI